MHNVKLWRQLYYTVWCSQQRRLYMGADCMELKLVSLPVPNLAYTGSVGPCLSHPSSVRKFLLILWHLRGQLHHNFPLSWQHFGAFQGLEVQPLVQSPFLIWLHVCQWDQHPGLKILLAFRIQMVYLMPRHSSSSRCCKCFFYIMPLPSCIQGLWSCISCIISYI